jgi:hypothetical protein
MKLFLNIHYSENFYQSKTLLTSAKKLFERTESMHTDVIPSYQVLFLHVHVIPTKIVLDVWTTNLNE